MSEPWELATELRSALSQLYLRIGSRVPGLGLTVPQTSALMTLLNHGPLRMGELAEREQVKTPTVTSTVDGLTQLGLVERHPDPDDRRAVLAALTDQGRGVIAEIAQRRNQHLADLMEPLTAPERETLRAALPVLRKLLAADLQKAPEQ
jgi:DNA-binding MarR family transcriptional regulator